MDAARSLALALCLLACGCRSVGRPVATAGENMGSFGAAVMTGLSVTVVLIPVGVGIGGPIIVLGAPLYYGGNALAGDRSGTYPDL